MTIRGKGKPPQRVWVTWEDPEFDGIPDCSEADIDQIGMETGSFASEDQTAEYVEEEEYYGPVFTVAQQWELNDKLWEEEEWYNYENGEYEYDDEWYNDEEYEWGEEQNCYFTRRIQGKGKEFGKRKGKDKKGKPKLSYDLLFKWI